MFRIVRVATVLIVLGIVCVSAFPLHIEKQDEVFAVLHFEGNQEYSNLMEGLVEHVLSECGVTMVERRRLAVLLEELQLQQAGITAESDALSLGKQLGANRVIVGKVRRVGDELFVLIRMLAIETGEAQLEIKFASPVEYELLRQTVVDELESVIDCGGPRLLNPPPDIKDLTFLDKLPQHIDMGTQKAILVRGGWFVMGCRGLNCPGDAKPAHWVWVDPFYMHDREVHYNDYRKCVDARQCARAPAWSRWTAKRVRRHFSAAAYISGIQRSAAAAYCTWLGGRLPTEAEWEFVASQSDVTWIQSREIVRKQLRESLLNDRGTDDPLEILYGDFTKTPEGFVNLFGGVAEWCADNYNGAGYPSVDEINPNHNRGTQPNARGGIDQSSGERYFFDDRPWARYAPVVGLTKQVKTTGMRCVFPL